MLPVVSDKFELACIFFAIFSFHYHCQLVKDQLQQKSGGATGYGAVVISR